jgi:hypothetical protein
MFDTLITFLRKSAWLIENRAKYYFTISCLYFSFDITILYMFLNMCIFLNFMLLIPKLSLLTCIITYSFSQTCITSYFSEHVEIQIKKCATDKTVKTGYFDAGELINTMFKLYLLYSIYTYIWLWSSVALMAYQLLNNSDYMRGLKKTALNTLKTNLKKTSDKFFDKCDPISESISKSTSK